VAEGARLDVPVLRDGRLPLGVVAGVAAADGLAVLHVAPLVLGHAIDVGRGVVADASELGLDVGEAIHAASLDREEQRVRLHDVAPLYDGVGRSERERAACLLCPVLVEGLAALAKAEAPGLEVQGRVGHHVAQRAGKGYLDGSQALVLLDDDARGGHPLQLVEAPA
jgi:hypothetical protein